MHHCLVTPDLIGPIQNGGIGTYVHWQARALAEADEEVTILFTGPLEIGTLDEWQGWYRRLGIRLVWLELESPVEPAVHATPLHRRSVRVFEFLRSKIFDAIHFQDWQANGLMTARARAVLGEFQNTALTLTLHSNTRWIAEGNVRWYDNPVTDAMTSWAEAYVARHVDRVFSPSRYLAEWCRERGWQTREPVHILPYCSGPAPVQPRRAAEPGQLAFFGRLETRKGLEIFVRGLKALNADTRQRIRQVHFVGKVGAVSAGRGDDYIRSELAALGVPHSLVTDRASQEAIAYLDQASATIFMPSLMDNFPFTVLESARIGLPIQAARVGGIPEMLGEECLFDPSVIALRDRLSQVLQGEPPPARLLVDPLRLTEEAVSAFKSLRLMAVSVSAEPADPKVSICVPFFNYGRYLPALLRSLRAQTYTNLDVVILDDGSTDKHSIDVFDQLKNDPEYAGYRFLRHANQGIGATRNAAAAAAQGEFLIFVDADNLARPEMVRTFVECIQRTGADVLTCHFDAFRDEGGEQWPEKILYSYLPIGPAVEAGWRQNVFGDANFCIRREVFEASGGFSPMRDASWEDWELLARLTLAGYKLDVIPRSLFWYRHTEMGVSRNTSPVRNQKRVLGAYLDALPVHLRHSVELMAQSAFQAQPGQYTPAGEIAARITDRIYKAMGSPEGRIAKALEKFFRRILGD
jgi:glycosyltransferase involved in cell wall biosynthesis/GT2 family glycosyltransferase